MTNRKRVDRVILSSDLNGQFLNFWPIAAESWRRIFSIEPTLALVSKEPVDQDILQKLKKFGDVHVFISKSNAPMPNQAKMARWYLAGKLENELVTIEDIDTIYMSSDYLLDRLKSFKNGLLLGIGSDVNQDDPAYYGKFPASNLTGETEVFRKFFGSHPAESLEEFLDRFRGMNLFDGREDPFNKPRNFSDESLIRALRASHKSDLVITIPRDVDIRNEWMDRSWWPENGEIPDKAILANLLRPLYNNQDRCRKLIQLYFEDEYPWIIKRKSKIWENPDQPIRIKARSIVFTIRQKLSSD